MHSRNEEKVTRALLGPRFRLQDPVMTTRFYPQNIAATTLKYSKSNRRKLQSDVCSSGPVTPSESPGVSATEMESMLLKSSRGETFAKIARRNPQGWQKIVKAQLEHEKFLNSMRFFERGFFPDSNQPDDHKGVFYNAEIAQYHRKELPNLKSFQIPWKNNIEKSKFVSPTEQRKNAFISLRQVSTEPPQTPPEDNTSKSGQSTADEQKVLNKNKDGIVKVESRKPYASLLPQFKAALPLRIKPLSLNSKRDAHVPDTTPSITFKQPVILDSFHNQLQSGLLSRARRVEIESSKSYLSPDSLKSFNSHKSQSYFNFPVNQSSNPQSQKSNSEEAPSSNFQQPQSTNSQKSSNSQKSQFFSNSQKSLNSSKSQLSHFSSDIPSFFQRSQMSSEGSSSTHDSNYLRKRLLKEAEKSDENILQQKFESTMLGGDEQQDFMLSTTSSYSNVTTEVRKPRMLHQSPILPVFIQSPYYKRMDSPSSDDRQHIKALQRRLEQELEEKMQHAKTTL